MKWITRERPKIDRIACPWLILKYIDKDAEFIFVPYEMVIDKAKKLKAIPFDLPGVEHTHYGTQCTFDYFIKKYKLTDPALKIIANIVRGADTDRHDLANEAAGLWAISAGFARNITDDRQLVEKGRMIYDALHSWATYLIDQKHLKNSPFENSLQNVFSELLKNNVDNKKKQPKWVKELKEILQDQVDTNYTFSLKEFSEKLGINSSYLSRKFSEHFDNLKFGEYIRKIRIDKAIQLIQTTKLSLSEIAYLTGFSDSSHFNRIFKKHTGKNPSEIRGSFSKSKVNTKDK